MDAVDITITAARVVAIFICALSFVPVLLWMERKGAAYIQDRRGPNRASILGIRMGGLIHSVADAIKLFTKEGVAAAGVCRPLYYIAPVLAMSAAVVAVAVIPFSETIEIYGRSFSVQVADLRAGLVYVFAVFQIGTFAVIFAGWASNNKYSLLGALRAAAQTISYSLSMALAAAALFIVAGSLSLSDITIDQGVLPWCWNVVRQPVAFIIFFVALIAETRRLPFDLPEGEPEIVAGYHVEYSGMRFALFYVAEYLHVAIGSAILATLFFGGWQVPFVTGDCLRGLELLDFEPAVIAAIIQVSVMFVKTIAICAVFIWVRWTLPRFRYDQLMRLGWKVLLPLSIANIVVTCAVLLYFSQH